jgi:hypothetical protein
MIDSTIDSSAGVRARRRIDSR